MRGSKFLSSFVYLMNLPALLLFWNLQSRFAVPVVSFAASGAGQVSHHATCKEPDTLNGLLIWSPVLVCLKNLAFDVYFFFTGLADTRSNNLPREIPWDVPWWHLYRSMKHQHYLDWSLQLEDKQLQVTWIHFTVILFYTSHKFWNNYFNSTCMNNNNRKLH